MSENEMCERCKAVLPEHRRRVLLGVAARLRDDAEQMATTSRDYARGVMHAVRALEDLAGRL